MQQADTTATSPPSTLSSPWLFFGVVFGWSWLFWIPTAALGISLQSGLGRALELLGLLGPMLGGIGFTYLTRSREGWLEYWSRIVDPRRVRPTWYLIIFLFAPGLWAVAVLLDVVSGGSSAPELIGERLAPFLSAPSTIVPFLLLVLVNGPIPEEFGWRGYVLDRLQARWSALVSSLVLGAAWALYHLPLFYIKDSFHYDQGAWSAWFWLFMVQVIALAFIFTWIFNNTHRSTLGAILFHFTINITAELVNRTDRANFYATLLWVAAAIVVVAFSGARLTRHAVRWHR